MFIRNLEKIISKPRVLHAPIVPLYQPYLYVKGLRELGYKADYMAFNFDKDSWLARSCDIDLQLDGTEDLHTAKSKEIDFFIYAIENYDIFHFHSGYGLLNSAFGFWDRLSEIKYLKKIGKKVFISWWGCDIRTEDIDGRYIYSACNKCEDSIRKSCNSSAEKKDVIKKAYEYSNYMFSCGDLAASYKGIEWLDIAIDCDEWKPLKFEEIPTEFRLPKTDKIRIYHSFGNSQIRGDVKGTYFIKEAVNKLQNEGVNVEFIFFDKIPNKDLKYFQAQADIVVDQLYTGFYGSTGAECLAMGNPVVTYIRPEVEAILPHKHPLINANIENIYFVLKDLLNDKEKIKEIGLESRKYTLEYHHYKNVAKELDKYYRRSLKN